MLFLAIIQASDAFRATVPLTFRHAGTITHSRAAIDRHDQAHQLCITHQLTRGRCRFLQQVFQTRLDVLEGPIISAVPATIRYAGRSTRLELAVRYATESATDAASRFCLKEGVNDCASLVEALQPCRLLANPVVGELTWTFASESFAFGSAGGTSIIRLHECEHPETVARIECMVAAVGTGNCSALLTGLLRLLPSTPQKCADQPKFPSKAVELFAHQRNIQEARMDHRIRSMEDLVSPKSHHQTMAWLLKPLDPEKFRSESFGLVPELLRRGPDHYRALFETADFVSLVEAFLQPTSPIHQLLYVIAVNGTFKVNTHLFNDIGEVYLSGYSTVINNIEALWHPASELSDALGRSYLLPGFNLYATPPASVAFPPHSDDQDVFILQVSGKKHWSVYEAPIPAPYRQHQFGKPADKVGVHNEVPPGLNPLIETTLRTGDLLYIPRGHIHNASCDLEHGSVHLTLTVNSPFFSWGPMLRFGLEAAQETAQMRTAPHMSHVMQDTRVAFQSLSQVLTARKATETLRNSEGFKDWIRYGVRGSTVELHSPPAQANTLLTVLQSSNCAKRIQGEKTWPRKREVLEVAWKFLIRHANRAVAVKELPLSDDLTKLLVTQQLQNWECIFKNATNVNV